MPQSNRLLRKRPAIVQNDVWTPGDIVQIETVCSVAEADGGFDAEERIVVLRLCELSGVDPALYDLTPRDPERR